MERQSIDRLRHYFDNVKPREGVHAYRLFDIAIVDLGLVIIGAWWLSWYMRWSFWKVFLVAFLIGIAAHRFFNIRTKVDTIIFDV